VLWSQAKDSVSGTQPARSQARNEQRSEHTKARRGGKTDAERDAEQQIEGVIHKRQCAAAVYWEHHSLSTYRNPAIRTR
jgi:hypothetical protein